MTSTITPTSLCAALVLGLAASIASPLQAQFLCDPSITPVNLQVTENPALGLVLSWDATPGSVGARLRVETPSGGTIKKRIVGSEPDALVVPFSALENGVYTWSVQAACSTTPPYDLTDWSALNTYVYSTGSTCPMDVSDIDGNLYPVVDIAGSCWMGTNLRTSSFTNGDSIPTDFSNSAWKSLSGPGFGIYPVLDSLTDLFGYHYNWFAVDDARGICPTGWHVPSNAEWTDLRNAFGGASVAGGPIKSTSSFWLAPNTAASNASGFTAEPAGYRQANGLGSFVAYRDQAIFWSTTPASSSSRALGVRLYSDDDLMNTGDFLKQLGTSVRCVQD